MRIEPLSYCFRSSLVPLVYSGRSPCNSFEVAYYLDSFLDLQPSSFLIGCRPDQWRGFLITVSQLGLVSSSSSLVSSSSSPLLESFITSSNKLKNHLGSSASHGL